MRGTEKIGQERVSENFQRGAVLLAESMNSHSLWDCFTGVVALNEELRGRKR